MYDPLNWFCILQKFFEGLPVGELARAILEKLATSQSPEELESDLVDLCGFEWLDEIELILRHRAQLLTGLQKDKVYNLCLIICLNCIVAFINLE